MPLASGQNEGFSAPSSSLNAPLILSPLDGGTPTCEACSIAGVGALDPLGPVFFARGRKAALREAKVLASAPQKL